MTTAAELWSERARQRWWQRVLQFAPVRAVIAIAFLVPGTIVDAFPLSRHLSLAVHAVCALAAIGVLGGSFAGFARLVEGRRPRELALRGAAHEWLVGTAAGAALFATALGVLVALGTYRVGAGDGVMPLVSGVVVFAPHALFEELLLRAVIFKIAEESLGTWAALAGQALLFGALHLGNPHASVFGAVAIAFEAGILLAAAYMLTRRLWLAWGIHFGWNWIQGSFFGVRVSGTEVGSSLLHSTPHGPAPG